MMPSVLLKSSTPSRFFRSHFPPRSIASACGIFRATQSRSEKACSAVEIVFPPGAFITITPRRVASSTSTLSIPTPARPTTRSFDPAFNDRRGDLRLAAHDDPAEFRNDFHERRFAQAGLGRDFERAVARQFVDAALRNGIRDQNFREPS